MGTDFMSAIQLAAAAHMSRPEHVLTAEQLVLEALKWDLNLVTPAHFISLLSNFEAYEDDLNLVCICNAWGLEPNLKPSVVAARLTEDPMLLAECSASELAEAQKSIFLPKR